MPVRRRHIRALVDRLLLANRVSAIPVDVELLARKLGAEIQREPADDHLSGFILRKQNRRGALIGVNANHHPNRQRFTIAHEIGHFLLHDHDDLHVDRADCGIYVRLRNEESSKGEDDVEKEANLFAAELLMPATLLERDVTSLDGGNLSDEDVLARLAKQYQVSTQALAFRLAYLGFLQL